MALSFNPKTIEEYKKTSNDYKFNDFSKSSDTTNMQKAFVEFLNGAAGMTYNPSKKVQGYENAYKDAYKALQDTKFKESGRTTNAYKGLENAINDKPGEYKEGSDVTKAKAAYDAVLKAKPGDFQYDDSALQAVYDKIMNRDDFSFDLNSSSLYQQYKQQYTALGQQAMMDTMGQAAALSGGYGSSYAQSAGQQAYQAQLQNLADIVPKLYQQALNTYEMEGSQLLNQYSVASSERDDAYQKYRNEVADWQNDRDFAYNVYGNERNFDYGQYRDKVSDYFSNVSMYQDLYNSLWGQDYNLFSSELDKNSSLASLAANAWQYQNDFEYGQFNDQRDAQFKTADLYQKQYDIDLSRDLETWKQGIENKKWAAEYDKGVAELNSDITSKKNQIGLNTAIAKDDSNATWAKIAEEIKQNGITNSLNKQKFEEDKKNNNINNGLNILGTIGSLLKSNKGSGSSGTSSGSSSGSGSSGTSSGSSSGSGSSGTSSGSNPLSKFGKITQYIGNNFGSKSSGGSGNYSVTGALVKGKDGTFALDTNKLSDNAKRRIAALRRRSDGKPDEKWFQGIIRDVEDGYISEAEGNTLLTYYGYIK